jgi:predicted enzyme related to lactoylglutathione lyase
MPERKPGEFCWINLLTPDVEAAKAFYSAVLGWTYGEIPGMGWSILANGGSVGGLFDTKGPNSPPGTQPQLGVMVKVENADATVAKINAGGGKATPAWDIGPNGRMAVCHDPTGAAIDIWQSLARPAMVIDGSTPGAPTWFENETTDTARAAQFYADVFGWTAVPMGSDYTVFKLGDASVGGMEQLGSGSASPAPHWATYIAVLDASRAVGEATKLGATVRRPLHDVPGVGKSASFTSPQGVPFAVLEYA